jgi:hypothetical protein
LAHEGVAAGKTVGAAPDVIGMELPLLNGIEH